MRFHLKSNPDFMKQLILFPNLIDNAIKYSKEEGFVRLTLLEDSKRSFSPEDDGIGIPSEEILIVILRDSYRVDKS